MRATWNPPPGRRPRWPYDCEAQPPRPASPMPPGPIVPGAPPTGHSQLTANYYQGGSSDQPWWLRRPDGTLVGPGLPLVQDPGPAPVDGRTCALQALGRFLTENLYRRRGNAGDAPVASGQVPALALVLQPSNFFVDEPDGEQDMQFPSIVCLGGSAEMTNASNEPTGDSIDVYGVGTAVVPQWLHDETFAMKIYGTQLGELRGLVGGVTQLLQPSQGVQCVRLVLPDYYGEVARFTLVGAEWPEGADAARNRRYATLRIRLEFKVCRLVAYQSIVPVVQSDVETPAFASALTSPGQGDDDYPANP